MYNYLGFDKSSYDGTVDWKKAKSKGITWATVRASYGTTIDKLYIQESQKAFDEGINVVPYHWYVPRKYTPQTQAAMFLSSATHGNMPAMLDLENSGTAVAYSGIAVKELKIWLDIVTNITGILPIIYSSPSYIMSYLAKDTWLSEYPLLLAHYRVAAPLVSKPWTHINLAGWQFGGDDADAKYYGFEQALGCSLQIFYDLDKYKHNWSV